MAEGQKILGTYFLARLETKNFYNKKKKLNLHLDVPLPKMFGCLLKFVYYSTECTRNDTFIVIAGLNC